ncbi:MAG: glycosyltransferase family 39 protein [Aquificaceae bacterium]|nr:glycosyltransferase family 39 protein [Aquificaceae bacterium]
MLLLLICLAFLSLIPNLHRYPFKNEESLRHLIAFEMWHSGNYLQPTLFGEPYFNKPPLFNWLIALYSFPFPWSELTGRMVSLSSLFFVTLLTALLSYLLFKKPKLSLLSALIFLTFGNVLFFYGYLAEIDITLTLFLLSSLLSLHLWWEKEKPIFAVVSGLLLGLSVLLKGFPSYAFLSLSLLAFSIYHRKIKLLWRWDALILYALCIFIPFLWLVLTTDPILYFSHLWKESFGRVDGEFSRLRHMLFYPLLNLKDLLPWSLILFLALYSLRNKLCLPPQIKLLLLLFFLNYLPYWISNSAGRYILPMYPILAVLFSFYIWEAMREGRFRRFVFGLLLLTIGLRLIYGLFYFPYQEQKEGSRKRLAKDIVGLIDLKKKLACECPEEKSLCLYLGLFKGEPLKRLSKEPEAYYAITCDGKVGEPIKEYKLGERIVSIERLHLK